MMNYATWSSSPLAVAEYCEQSCYRSQFSIFLVMMDPEIPSGRKWGIHGKFTDLLTGICDELAIEMVDYGGKLDKLS